MSVLINLQQFYGSRFHLTLVSKTRSIFNKGCSGSNGVRVNPSYDAEKKVVDCECATFQVVLSFVNGFAGQY